MCSARAPGECFFAKIGTRGGSWRNQGGNRVASAPIVGVVLIAHQRLGRRPQSGADVPKSTA